MGIYPCWIIPWKEKLPISLVKNTMARIWGQAGLNEALIIDEGSFFFMFNSKESCEAVWKVVHGMLQDNYRYSKKWHQSLKLENNVSKIPIWVRLFNVPLEYWTEEGLRFIASIVGKPLHVDKMTATCKRIIYARVCTEIGADEDLINEFDIEIEGPNGDVCDTISIKGEYQWVPSQSCKCKVFGHDCLKLVKKVAPPPQKYPRVQTSQWVEMKRKNKPIVDAEVATQNEPTSVVTPMNIVEKLRYPQVKLQHMLGKLLVKLLNLIAFKLYLILK